MNKRISRLYFALNNNRVVFADTSLLSLVNQISSVTPDITYAMLDSDFKKSNYFDRTSKKNGKTFTFQVIEY